MHSFVLAAVLSIAAARPQLPAGNVNDDHDGDEGDDRDKSCWQKVTLKSRPGLSAAQCPNYPFCGAAAPADFPVPVVNGAPVAPVLNTTPEQTQYWQQAQVKESAILGQKIKPLLRKWNLIKKSKVAQSPAAFPVTTVNGENVAPGYNTVPYKHAKSKYISIDAYLLWKNITEKHLNA